MHGFARTIAFFVKTYFLLIKLQLGNKHKNKHVKKDYQHDEKSVRVERFWVKLEIGDRVATHSGLNRSLT